MEHIGRLVGVGRRPKKGARQKKLQEWQLCTRLESGGDSGETYRGLSILRFPLLLYQDCRSVWLRFFLILIWFWPNLVEFLFSPPCPGGRIDQPKHPNPPGYALAPERTGGKEGWAETQKTDRRLLLQSMSLPDTQDWTHIPVPPCAPTVVDPVFQDSLGTLYTAPELAFINYQGSQSQITTQRGFCRSPKSLDLTVTVLPFPYTAKFWCAAQLLKSKQCVIQGDTR